MKEWRTHFQGANGPNGNAACGNSDSEAFIVSQWPAVDCQRCARTALYNEQRKAHPELWYAFFTGVPSDEGGTQ